MTTQMVRLWGIAVALALFPPAAAAQGRAPVPREIPGFDFRPDGVWRVRARQVALRRRALLAQLRFAELNAPVALAAPRPSAAAVTGALAVPMVLISYPGIDTTQFMRDPAQYSALLFGPSAPSGLPFTLNQFYDSLSRGLFGITGQVSRWARLPQSEVTYTGTPSTECEGRNPYGTTNCNGVWSDAATDQLHVGLREALARVDTGPTGINFAQFDNDGPDGVPNSPDDDGFVDLVLFAHATQDGACGGASNNHVWSHRFTLGDTQLYFTNDPSSQGGSVKVADYLIQSALGGRTSCDVNDIMPIGTTAHELGHGIGLPDLYDVAGNSFGPSEGVGQWSLMGSGNFTSPRSPSRMDAWSLNELGWVTLAPLTTAGSYSFGPAPVSDTAFLVRVQGSNPRGEYFLLENRQASQADTAMIVRHCFVSTGSTSGACGGGLLVWHVDSAKVVRGRLDNSVNNGPIHGLALEQADGFRNLDVDANTSSSCAVGGVVNGCSDRGDAGDPYGEFSGNTTFSFRTNPAATKNADGSFAGFAVDQVTQVVPRGTMSFRLRFGALSVVRASDTAAVIQFQGTNYTVFRDLLENGGMYTVSVADTQIAANGRTRWRFASWSDGGLRTHPITGSVAGDTLIATLDRDFQLIATAAPGGTISANPPANLSGDFLAEGSTIELTATPNSGETFSGWSGDTSTTDPVLTLTMNRAYTVFACFGTVAITSPSPLPDGVMGVAYDQTLQVSCGAGTNWAVTAGALPQGVTLNPGTGRLSGFPRQSGAFSFTASVMVGGQPVSKPFALSIAAPALTTADVVAQLLGPTAPLTADQLRYLDFLGNNNGTFDIGDFLAWVKATGAP